MNADDPAMQKHLQNAATLSPEKRQAMVDEIDKTNAKLDKHIQEISQVEIVLKQISDH